MSSPNVIVRSLRRPEFVGENRCSACTAVNLVIAAALGGLVGLVSPPAGAAVVAISLLVITLRGYLIPGTPTLTKRYLPDRLLEWFGKEPFPEIPPARRMDVEQTLHDLGLVEPCPDEADLCLDPGFHQAYRSRVTEVRAEAGNGALGHFGDLLDPSRLDVSPDALDVGLDGDAFTAAIEGRPIARWESRGAYLADVAAASVLARRYPDWSSIDFDQRTQIVGGLRLFLERCPLCDGSVTLGEDTVESCCREVPVIAATCEDCGERVFETARPET